MPSLRIDATAYDISRTQPASVSAASSTSAATATSTASITLSSITIAVTAEAAAQVRAPIKSKRVRTGCLTCRQRHLKCDESLPDCANCCKSSRKCQRGIRLNFIDTQVRQPPIIPTPTEWLVRFQDESRQIAAEYCGGLSRYEFVDNINLDLADSEAQEQTPRLSSHPSLGEDSDGAAQGSVGSSILSLTAQNTNLTSSTHVASGIMTAADDIVKPMQTAFETIDHVKRDYLGSSDEVFYMRVFVEHVGVWMDGLDCRHHFSQHIPFLALRSPMLLNALLACGVKCTALANPELEDEQALFYYDTATTQLLRSLQNPDRNTGECAAAAVVLNVYEIMSERPQERMNHIAGARALIRECGWDARSEGVGAACFWVNIGMEVLNCLAYNWQTAWNPDLWGVDMNMEASTCTSYAKINDPEVLLRDSDREEELWMHRIFYIVAHVANFRASQQQQKQNHPQHPRQQQQQQHQHTQKQPQRRGSSRSSRPGDDTVEDDSGLSRDGQVRVEAWLAQWQELKRLCDQWNQLCPRSMHPFGYLHVGQARSGSAFPNIWLINRSAIIGRLLYHIALCILAEAHPIEHTLISGDMRSLQLHHARQACGIIAHTSNLRPMAAVAARGLAVVAVALSDPGERQEAVGLISRVGAQSGWRLDKAIADLRRGWDECRNLAHQQAAAVFQPQLQAPPPPVPLQPLQPHVVLTAPLGRISVQARQSIPGSAGPSVVSLSTVNPLSSADFNLPNHPYQNWYEPPNRHAGPFGESDEFF